MWKLTRDETNYGIPQRALRGHSHFVSDVVISSDGQFALSGSWDGTLRLWDLTTQVAAHLALGPWEKIWAEMWWMQLAGFPGEIQSIWELESRLHLQKMFGVPRFELVTQDC